MDYNSLPIGFGMALAMNPPAFNAYSNLTEEEKEILTDACKILVLKGEKVHLVEGEVFNMKITYPFDLRVAQSLLGGNEKC